MPRPDKKTTYAEMAGGLRAIRKQRDWIALRGWISQMFKVGLPYRAFTPGHSTPMKFVADAFFNPGQDIAAWANRSGIKTLGASILAALEFMVTDGLQARVLSGSEDQAKNLYKYWSDWCADVLAWRVKGDVNKLLTRVGGGQLEILSASMKRVHGPKVQRLFEDELDEIDPAIDMAAVGMIDSRPGMPGRTVYTSTWHYAHGPMGTMVAACPDNGVELHKWNLWESIANCPISRHQNGTGCKSCPLGKACLDRARLHSGNPSCAIGIASRATGLYAIDDAIKAVRKVDEDTWSAEYICDRPVMGGTVYPKFDRGIHVLRDLDFDKTLPTFRAIDWGLNNFVCLWIQEGKQGQVYVVDEMWAENVIVAENAREIKRRDTKDWPPLKLEATFCDPAGRSRSDQTGYSDVDVLGSILGRKPRYKTDKWSTDVHNGIQLIRGALKPAVGKPRLFVAGACKVLIKAFESYKNRKINGEWVDDPVKPQPYDHGVDALRYYFVNRRRKSGDFIGQARNA